jgi:hypothetical protein
LDLFKRIFRRKEGQGRSKKPLVFVFFACPRGGAFDSSRESMQQVDQDFELRLLENDEFRDYWTAETKKKYGNAKISLFDVADWNPPELDLWSLEGDLPSIRTGALVRESVREVLTSRGIQPEIIERCCEPENEDRLYQSHPGLVIWWFYCPKDCATLRQNISRHQG